MIFFDIEAGLEKNTLYYFHNYNNWRPTIFLDSDDYKAFMGFIRICFSNHNYDLLAVVIKPNSYNVLVKRMGNGSLRECMYRAGVLYHKYFNDKYGSNDQTFQGAFSTQCINSYKEFSTVIDILNTQNKGLHLADCQNCRWEYTNMTLINFYFLYFEDLQNG